MNTDKAKIDKETDESNDVDDDTALQDMNPDSEEPQKTNDIQEPDETEEHHEIQKPHGTQQSHETHELRVTQEPNESQQTPKTRIRVSNKERKPPQMTHSIPNKKRAVEKLDAAFEILTKASNKEPPQDPSECQIFGNLVAKKLSKYSNVAQTAVQEAIMNILFAADKGYYNQYPAPRGYQSNNYSTIQSELVQRDSVYQDTQLIQSPYSPRPAAHWDFATDASSQAPQFSPVPLPLISPASASSQCSDKSADQESCDVANKNIICLANWYVVNNECELESSEDQTNLKMENYNLTMTEPNWEDEKYKIEQSTLQKIKEHFAVKAKNQPSKRKQYSQKIEHKSKEYKRKLCKQKKKKTRDLSSEEDSLSVYPLHDSESDYDIQDILGEEEMKVQEQRGKEM
ncbi:unnamed protein product [Ceutorhynchus assimilis]|uniref:Uncharacterized protein n=1 Tax=Ceutorhynchus assimilis TaxID=467358 RepID=A0A9N9MXT1_9CUCU|nr:unnamed protein product [Ceutorhynchus assimilis]